MRWAEISLRAAPGAVDAVSAALEGGGCGGVVILDPAARSTDPFAEQADSPEGGPGRWCTVTGYLPVTDRVEEGLAAIGLRVELLAAAGIDLDGGLSVRIVGEQSWADAWKQFFRPARVGRRWVVKPTWETWAAGPDDLVLEIDPGMAFGSGSHPSTRLCLLLMEDAVRPGDDVLDWGCGSGILSLAAARLGARSVTALDLDPVAVDVARRNVRQNGMQRIVDALPGSIETVAAERCFDLILANILADPIIDAAEELVRRLRPEGRLIAGGFVERREADVLRALRAAGLRSLSTLAEDEWRALLAMRASGASAEAGPCP